MGPARAKSSLQTPALRGGAGTKGRWPGLKLELWTHCSPCGGLLGIRATTVHTYPLEFPLGIHTEAIGTQRRMYKDVHHSVIYTVKNLKRFQQAPEWTWHIHVVVHRPSGFHF